MTMTNEATRMAAVLAAELFHQWSKASDDPKHGTAIQRAILSTAKAARESAPHPAWPAMLAEIEASPMKPRAFEADFWIHDRAILSAHNADQPFVWCFGETGTTLLWGPAKDARSLLCTLKEDRPAFYEWDGETLTPIDDKRLSELLTG